MSQHDFVIDNGPGKTVRLDIQSAVQSLVSNNSGSTAPTTTYAGMWWLDTSTGANGTLKIRDAANAAWLSKINLDVAGVIKNPVTAAGAAPAGPAAGDMWLNTTTGVLSIFQGGNWIPVGGGATSAATPPTAPKAGDLWVNSTDNKLHVYSGGAWQTVGGAPEFPDGTETAPSITNIGDVDTGLYFPAENTVAVTVGGSEHLRVSPTGIGVGTKVPDGPISVQEAGAPQITLKKSNGTTVAKIGTVGAGDYLRVNGTNGIELEAGAAGKIVVTPAGEIGIGGANFGTDRQAITSAGPGAAAHWGNLPPQAPVRGDPFAWVNYNTAGSSIISQRNISSVTRHAVTDWEAHFATPNTNANYTLSGIGEYLGPAKMNIGIPVVYMGNPPRPDGCRFHTLGIDIGTTDLEPSVSFTSIIFVR